VYPSSIVRDASPTSYDDVPYDSNPIWVTHPDHLAVVATLAGMRPAPVDHCRVLELGCASGGNLIPMAVALPGSQFVGVDLSPAQVGVGHATIAALGLPNVTLEARSILELDESIGTFDYVVCHGVYSWVPPAVQDAILAVFARHLAPQGVAYVSYNTHPGWHLRGMVRDMMLFHAARFAEPAERIRQARAFLDFLVAAVRRPDAPFGSQLREEAEMLRDAPDSYLFHEHLESDNQPVYFHEFVARATPHGLRYVGEAQPTTMLPGEFPPEVERTLRQMAEDEVQFEQYLDFLRNRTFRRTLLCHDDVSLQRAWSGAQFQGLFLSSRSQQVDEQESLVDPDVVARFRNPRGSVLSASHPLVKGALAALGDRAGERVPYRDLLDGAARRGGRPSPLSAEDEQGLVESLVVAWLGGFVELHSHMGRAARSPTERPLASPLARLQAAGGRRVSSLRHRVVELEDPDRRLLCLLDGTRDRAALVESLPELAPAGSLDVRLRGFADAALLLA
jgi:SAM-dependent methyltransferase